MILKEIAHTFNPRIWGEGQRQAEHWFAQASLKLLVILLQFPK